MYMVFGLQKKKLENRLKEYFCHYEIVAYNNIYLIGFSWDSDTAFSLDDISISQLGWNIAKNIANKNGPLLEQFIDTFKQQCREDNLRIIAILLPFGSHTCRT